jgi:uncharacterized protein (DUF2132 family)
MALAIPITRSRAINRAPEARASDPLFLKDHADTMNHPQPNNPLHGITLEQVVTRLVEHYGWSELGDRIDIRCFTQDPSIKSSLKFLRRTPWARKKVEDLYIAVLTDSPRS